MVINNVYQCVDLIAMPMHRLYFILHLKRMVFSKVHNVNNCVSREGDNISFELLILPPWYKIMLDKIL
jgi:hypothetical protein